MNAPPAPGTMTVVSALPKIEPESPVAIPVGTKSVPMLGQLLPAGTSDPRPLSMLGEMLGVLVVASEVVPAALAALLERLEDPMGARRSVAIVWPRRSSLREHETELLSFLRREPRPEHCADRLDLRMASRPVVENRLPAILTALVGTVDLSDSNGLSESVKNPAIHLGDIEYWAATTVSLSIGETSDVALSIEESCGTGKRFSVRYESHAENIASSLDRVKGKTGHLGDTLRLDTNQFGHSHERADIAQLVVCERGLEPREGEGRGAVEIRRGVLALEEIERALRAVGRVVVDRHRADHEGVERRPRALGHLGEAGARRDDKLLEAQVVAGQPRPRARAGHAEVRRLALVELGRGGDVLIDERAGRIDPARVDDVRLEPRVGRPREVGVGAGGRRDQRQAVEVVRAVGGVRPDLGRVVFRLRVAGVVHAGGQDRDHRGVPLDEPLQAQERDRGNDDLEVPLRVDAGIERGRLGKLAGG